MSVGQRLGSAQSITVELIKNPSLASLYWPVLMCPVRLLEPETTRVTWGSSVVMQTLGSMVWFCQSVVV